MKRKAFLRTCAFGAMAFILPSSGYAADDIISMFSEGETSGAARLYHFTKDNDGYSGLDDQQTTVVGGVLDYTTASLKGISLGVGFRAQFNIFNDDDTSPYYLFFPQESGVTDTDPLVGVNKAFLRYEGYGTNLTIGRQEIHTPYMNNDTFRMLPQAHQGVSITNESLKNVLFKAGYFTEYVDWNDGEYRDMLSSTTFGSQWVGPDSGGGAAMFGGVVYKPIRGLDVNGWYYYFEDAYSILRPEIKYFKFFNKDMKGFLALRYAMWDSVGDEYVVDTHGDEFETDMVVLSGMFEYKAWKFMFGVQKNGDDDLLEKFGSNRGVSQAVERSTRAEENAYLIHVGYDFTSLGVPGLIASARYGIYDNPDSGINANQDFTELDLKLLYRFSKSLEGLSVAINLGLVDKDEDQATLNPYWTLYGGKSRENTADCTDIRIYLEYAF